MVKKFTRRNEAFVCAQCGKDVPSGDHGILRNHCPFCLCSLHVDVNPGDRRATCSGVMPAFSAHVKGDEVVLKHRCARCGFERANKVARHPCATPDDMEKVYELMRKSAIAALK